MKKIILLLLVACCSLTACKSMEEGTATSAEIESTIEMSVGSGETETIDEEVTEPVVESDTEPITEPIVVSPLPNTIDVAYLDNCTIPVSLNKGDAYVDDSGVMQMKVTVYAYDLYDMVDISLLKEGDFITIRQQDIQIDSLEHDENGAVYINGGLDNGGYELRSNDNGVFFEIGYSDVKSYYPIGEATLPVSQDFEFIDSFDLDKEAVTYFPGDFLVEDSGIDYIFVPNHTSIVVEDGYITEMYRVYAP